MSESIQSRWDTFESWRRRYSKVSRKAVDEMFTDGFAKGSSLFVALASEIAGDPILDFNLSKEVLIERIESKISFIRGYLVDISNDGALFMAKHSRFLPLQYPSRCEKALGIWFERDLGKECEPGTYFGFQDFNVSIFVNKISDIDLESARNILPFDTMQLRKSDGSAWSKPEISELALHVKQDLEFSGDRYKIHSKVFESVLVFSVICK